MLQTYYFQFADHIRTFMLDYIFDVPTDEWQLFHEAIKTARTREEIPSAMDGISDVAYGGYGRLTD